MLQNKISYFSPTNVSQAASTDALTWSNLVHHVIPHGVLIVVNSAAQRYLLQDFVCKDMQQHLGTSCNYKISFRKPDGKSAFRIIWHKCGIRKWKLKSVWNRFNEVAGAVKASMNFSEHADRFYHLLIDIRWNKILPRGVNHLYCRQYCTSWWTCGSTHRT